MKKRQKKAQKILSLPKKKIKKGVKRSRASLAKIETLYIFSFLARAARV
jgi:hypothetical protein